MKKLLLPLFLLIIIPTGCVENHEKIDLSIVQEPDIRKDDGAVRVAIASVISPKESYAFYEDLIQYISKKLGGPVKIIQRRKYEEVNDLIRNNEIDFAFVCSGAYVEGHSAFGMKLLVAPEMYGATTYRSYLIVTSNSSYHNLTDLRGKKFAFSDPLSNSGYFFPTYRLSTMNETPKSFFGTDENNRDRYFFTYNHDSSVIAVAEQLADGAAVDSLVYDHMKNTRPDIISRTRIIEISPPFGIPPVVVPEDIDPYLERRLKDIFLTMDQDEEGRRILSNIMIDRFVTLDDNAYESVREIRKTIK